MVRVIMGVKGSGKTKQMIEMINVASESEHGNVVCIEYGSHMTFDLNSRVRLVEASQYATNTFPQLKGFISGLYAGNFDITHVFIDSLCKIVPSDPTTDPAVADFLHWLEAFSESNQIKFTVTISADASLVSEEIRKYF